MSHVDHSMRLLCIPAVILILPALASSPILFYMSFMYVCMCVHIYMSSQAALVVKNSSANAGEVRDVGLIPEEEHGNPFQNSCLENPMDRGAWWAVAHSVAKR